MAKEDFCFTYYDGDAARDKAHMNRLERGAYDDLISAQRKRGHLSIDDIKKVLSSDFSACWPSLEWVLKTDPAGKYFIEWVDMSIEKMRRHSEKQKQNVLKRYQKDTTVVPPYNNGSNLVMPLEDGNENGDEYENVSLKGGAGENFNTMPTDCQEPSTDYYELCCELVLRTKQTKIGIEQIKALWPVFKVQNLTGSKYYADVGAIHSHFMNWIKTQKFETKDDRNQSHIKQPAANNGLGAKSGGFGILMQAINTDSE